MKQLIEDFDKELQHALQIAKETSFSVQNKNIDNIVVTGLGGSGIGGSICASLLSKQMQVPMLINKGYFLPHFVNEKTLVIVCSYSGNTEESIHAFREALHKNAEITCITSGGELLELAKLHKTNALIIPGGRPPRASLGYSLTQIIASLQKYNIIKEDVYESLEGVIRKLQIEKDSINKAAFTLSESIYNKLPVLYCEEAIEPIAIRWKQQLNENSKMLCWHNVYPEMNHNELVGWREPNTHLALIFIKTGDEFYRNEHRMKLNEDIYKTVTDSIFHITAQGNTSWEKLFYLIHFGDWLSYHLAVKRGYDPMEIDVLINLKQSLSELK